MHGGVSLEGSLKKVSGLCVLSSQGGKEFKGACSAECKQKSHSSCFYVPVGPESWLVPSWPGMGQRNGKICILRAEAGRPRAFLGGMLRNRGCGMAACMAERRDPAPRGSADLPGPGLLPAAWFSSTQLLPRYVSDFT